MSVVFHPVQKIEIIVKGEKHEFVRSLLEQSGASGYTVIRDVAGKGDRGERGGDGLTDVFDNSYILIACEPEIVDKLLQPLRQMLHDFGGVCLVSDAHWVVH